ncbi:hypothetical protein D3C78_1634340 [compost metagenome]
MVRLNTVIWSARLSALPWRKLISICAGPSSWISVSRSSPWASHQSYTSSNSGSNSLVASMEKLWRPLSGRPERPTGATRGKSGSLLRLVR